MRKQLQTNQTGIISELRMLEEEKRKLEVLSSQYSSQAINASEMFNTTGDISYYYQYSQLREQCVAIRKEIVNINAKIRRRHEKMR